MTCRVGLASSPTCRRRWFCRVSRWLNDREGRTIIPEAVLLTKAPSAELRPNQTDQDSLPPYDVLDDIHNVTSNGTNLPPPSWLLASMPPSFNAC